MEKDVPVSPVAIPDITIFSDISKVNFSTPNPLAPKYTMKRKKKKQQQHPTQSKEK